MSPLLDLKDSSASCARAVVYALRADALRAYTTPPAKVSWFSYSTSHLSIRIPMFIWVFIWACLCGASAGSAVAYRGEPLDVYGLGALLIVLLMGEFPHGEHSTTLIHFVIILLRVGGSSLALLCVSV